MLEKKELPKGWIHFRFGDFLILKYGKSQTKKNRRAGNIPIYGSSGITGHHDESLVDTPCLVVGRKGSAGHISYVDTPCWPLDTTYFIDTSPMYDLKFLFWLMYNMRLNELDTSTAIPSLRRTDVYSLQIPLPPLNEQHRIVQKVESIFAQIDACKSRLERLIPQTSSVSGNLAQLKSSVLKQAFEGRLVRQDLNDEPVEELLRNLHKDKKLEFEKKGLPKGWIQTTIKNVVEDVKKINPKEMPNQLFYYCDINSIDNSQFVITTPKQFLGKDAPSRARQLIKHGDILFSTVRTYLKNIAIVPSDLNKQLASTGFCVLRPKQNIDNKFMFNYVQFDDFLKSLDSKQRGTSYPAVRNADVLDTMISLPPLNEQHRIVQKLESIFARIDAKHQEMEKLEIQLKSVPDSINMLKSSILKMAFEGRLVPQDPNDEPAEELLKKLQAKKSE